jgi:hypothetical protein
MIVAIGAGHLREHGHRSGEDRRNDHRDYLYGGQATAEAAMLRIIDSRRTTPRMNRRIRVPFISDQLVDSSARKLPSSMVMIAPHFQEIYHYCCIHGRYSATYAYLTTKLAFLTGRRILSPD